METHRGVVVGLIDKTDLIATPSVRLIEAELAGTDVSRLTATGRCAPEGRQKPIGTAMCAKAATGYVPGGLAPAVDCQHPACGHSSRRSAPTTPSATHC